MKKGKSNIFVSAFEAFTCQASALPGYLVDVSPFGT